MRQVIAPDRGGPQSQANATLPLPRRCSRPGHAPALDDVRGLGRCDSRGGREPGTCHRRGMRDPRPFRLDGQRLNRQVSIDRVRLALVAWDLTSGDTDVGRTITGQAGYHLRSGDQPLHFGNVLRPCGICCRRGRTRRGIFLHPAAQPPCTARRFSHSPTQHTRDWVTRGVFPCAMRNRMRSQCSSCVGPLPRRRDPVMHWHVVHSCLHPPRLWRCF